MPICAKSFQLVSEFVSSAGLEALPPQEVVKNPLFLPTVSAKETKLRNLLLDFDGRLHRNIHFMLEELAVRCHGFFENESLFSNSRRNEKKLCLGITACFFFFFFFVVWS